MSETARGFSLDTGDVLAPRATFEEGVVYGVAGDARATSGSSRT